MFCFVRFKALGQGAAALVAGLTFSQCALPPGTAWTVMRKDGVKDYFAISWGKKPVPDYVKELVPDAFGLPTPEVEDSEAKPMAEERGVTADGDAFPEVPGAVPEDWARAVEPVFPLMATSPPEVAGVGMAPVGEQGFGVNPLLGEVGNDEFAQVSLPDAVTAPVVSAPVGANAEKGKGAAPGLKMKDPVVAGPTAAVVRHLAEGLREERKLGSEVVVIGASDGKVAKFLPEMVPSAVAEEVPFGLLVAGRPGYVRSPFAQSHQIVDVTGLKVGTSVKCPFSGKFFRVPAGHEAMNEGEKFEGPVDDEIEAPEDKESE